MSQGHAQKYTAEPPIQMVKEHNPRETRKQLPSIPDVQTPATMATRPKQVMTGVRAVTNGYDPFLLEYSLMAEYALLAKQKIPGCYVIPSAKSPLVWNGVLFIRQGLYQEGAFKFSLTVPQTFPDVDCLKFVFDYPVFHPLVDPSTGELDIKRGFPKWRKSANHLWQVLLYARRIFYKIDTKSPLNQEAAELYEQDMSLFKSRVADTVGYSKNRLEEPCNNSDDAHQLKFSPLEGKLYEDTRQAMLKTKENISDDVYGAANTRKGLSWMSAGSVQIFSRDDSMAA